MEQVTSAVALWVLITVTNGATVHQESGFTSRALCEDAISIATYGQTVAEHQGDVRKREEERRVKEEQWRADHPAREPKTKEEKERAKYDGGWAGTSGCGHVKDGLIYDDPPTCYSVGWTGSGSTSIHDNEIKFARCLPDPGQPK